MMSQSDWKPVGGLMLEPNAVSAATAVDRNVVVSAGPGAGKTEMLAQRADFLLTSGQCPYPRRILAISFKVDAARNLRDRVRSRTGYMHANRFDSFTFDAFAKMIVDRYRPALIGQDSLVRDYSLDAYDRVAHEQITFDDLVPLALKILENNTFALPALRQTYSHVFLDEFQDATRNQYSFIKLAFLGTGAWLTAVGDTKQRIMAWAGALDGALQSFADDFDATSVTLYQNFRSAPRLRRMQNRMIASMDPSSVTAADDLIGDEGAIEVLEFPDQSAEADEVADRVAAWLANGVPAHEIAILVRQLAGAVTEDLGDALSARGIPHRNEQELQDRSVEPAAVLVLEYLRVVACDRRPSAYTKLFAMLSQRLAISDGTLSEHAKLGHLIQTARRTVRAADFNSRDRAAWRTIVSEFLKFVSRPTVIALSPAYRQGSWLNDVIRNVFNDFVNQVTVDGDADQALARLSDVDAIRIYTVHKCKGLEFQKVVVLGVERELFWSSHVEVMSEFFVAISRAKDELVLTWARTRAKPRTYSKRWDISRRPYADLLQYADDLDIPGG